ncbi:MAG: HAD family hydrolase [Candidatus Doudnabacteria bacterium]|nr:HAD family hydrolase [Candidatus Doudnabacteria bacterium]
MIKLVAFDWNGTILSDTNPVLRAENAVRDEFGLKDTNLKEFQDQYDIPIKKYWLAAGFDEAQFDRESDRIQKIFLDHYEPLEKICRTRSGVREIFEWLRSNAITICIFSNHPEGHIVKQSERLNLRDYLHTILGRDTSNSHMHKRSKGDKLHKFVTEQKLQPQEVLTVGDTTEEIDIAKTYGYTSVAITAGYQSVKRLKSAKPDFIINNLINLKEIIQNHGRTT